MHDNDDTSHYMAFTELMGGQLTAGPFPKYFLFFWNNLPVDIRQSDSVEEAFKYKLTMTFN